MLMICRAKAVHFMATYAGETLKKNAFYGDPALLRDAGAGHIKSLPQRLIKHFPGISPMVVSIALCMTARAESVVFSGAEGSAKGGYGYVGTVIPMAGEELGRGWYYKTVASMVHYHFESSDRGATEEVSGRSLGIEGGVGHAWQFGPRRLDLSATLGYRRIRLSPFEPRDEKTGDIITFTPQVMAYTPLAGAWDADLIANYSFGLGSSFVRLRGGFKPAEGWRAGVETKRLRGETYETHTGGVFLSVPLNKRVTLDMTAGREKPRDDPSVSYGGVAFVVVF